MASSFLCPQRRVSVAAAVLLASVARAQAPDQQPSLEFATPEQIGVPAPFLCSDAAAQIRGAARPVDGGWTAQ